MKVLLDTNAYTAFARGDRVMAEVVRRAGAVHLSVITVGELLHGFRNGTRYHDNLAVLTRFSEQPWVTVLPVTRATAERYARIATAQRRKGRPIPSNDLWIAAHAMETGADLVSYDDHFGAVDGLVWVKPGDPDAGVP